MHTIDVIIIRSVVYGFAEDIHNNIHKVLHYNTLCSVCSSRIIFLNEEEGNLVRSMAFS